MSTNKRLPIDISKVIVIKKTDSELMSSFNMGGVQINCVTPVLQIKVAGLKKYPFTP